MTDSEIKVPCGDQKCDGTTGTAEGTQTAVKGAKAIVDDKMQIENSIHSFIWN